MWREKGKCHRVNNIFYSFVGNKNFMFCQVPTRAEEITIPADVTPEKVPTHIVDYCG